MSSLDVRAIDDKELRREACPPAKQEFRIFLAETAFDRAVERGASDTTREIGGVLFGEVLRDDAGPYLRIEGTIDALHAEEKGAELTFTHATWEHINKEMDGKHQGKRLVGWYHTHPGFGIFLSDRDQFIHRSFFDLPFQVAFVYDPKSREHGMFTWHDNEVSRARRYWIGEREQVWDGPRALPEKAEKEKAGKRDKPDTEDRRSSDGEPRADDGLAMSLAPLVIVGVLFLLVGGFAGHWIGSGSAGRELIAAQTELNKVKAEGAREAIESLDSTLVGLLRDTVGDQVVRTRIVQAIGDLEATIAALESKAVAPPAAGSGSAAGSGAAAGSGSAAGSGAAPAAGSGEVRPLPPVAQLKIARDNLRLLLDDQRRAAGFLADLERVSRRGGELRADMGHELATQRAGLGTLYAELALDAARTGDKDRARRLLSQAAHLDPGNRARYEKQLQSFDKSASLPRETGTDLGSGGQGAKP